MFVGEGCLCRYPSGQESCAGRRPRSREIDHDVLALAAMVGALEPKAAERQRLILQSARKRLRLNTPVPGRDNGLPTQAAVESYDVGRTCGAQPLDQEVPDPRLASSNRNVRMAQTVARRLAMMGKSRIC
jgi:hypothetical protein